jgi:hypothetical protein
MSEQEPKIIFIDATRHNPTDTMMFIDEPTISYNRDRNTDTFTVHASYGKEAIKTIHNNPNTSVDVLNAKLEKLFQDRHVQLGLLTIEYSDLKTPWSEEQQYTYNLKHDRIVAIGNGANSHLYDCFEILKEQLRIHKYELQYKLYLPSITWDFKFTMKKECMDIIKGEIQKVGEQIYEQLRDIDNNRSLQININRELIDESYIYCVYVCVCID